MNEEETAEFIKKCLDYVMGNTNSELKFNLDDGTILKIHKKIIEAIVIKTLVEYKKKVKEAVLKHGTCTPNNCQYVEAPRGNCWKKIIKELGL